MRATLLFVLCLWLVTLVTPQSFTCTTAPAHAHNAIREGQIKITSWSGCTMLGTINGVSIQLWADSSRCALRDKVPGTFQIRYDATCGQVIDLSSGPLPPYCPATPTPTPNVTPTPTPTPTPVPSPTPAAFHVFGTVYLTGTTTPFSGAWVDVSDSGGRLIQRVGEDAFGGTNATGSFDFNTRMPAGTVLSAFSGKHPNVAFSTVTINRDGPYTIFATSPTPLPTPTPVPSPTPTPTPVPSPSPTASCEIASPAAIGLPRNGAGTVSVTVSNPTGSAMTISAASSSGQVTVSPFSQRVAGVNVVASFFLRTKRQGATVTFTSPCGSRTTTVVVR